MISKSNFLNVNIWLLSRFDVTIVYHSLGLVGDVIIGLDNGMAINRQQAIIAIISMCH